MFDHASSVCNLIGLKPIINTLDSLDRAVSRGLPAFCIDYLAKSIFPDQKKANEFVQRLSLETNNLEENKVLTPATSMLVERLARTFALANYVFDDLNDARAFFTNQHRLFNGQTPLDIAMTELGAIRVAQLLQQLYFGVLPHIPNK